MSTLSFIMPPLSEKALDHYRDPPAPQIRRKGFNTPRSELNQPLPTGRFVPGPPPLLTNYPFEHYDPAPPRHSYPPATPTYPLGLNPPPQGPPRRPYPASYHPTTIEDSQPSPPSILQKSPLQSPRLARGVSHILNPFGTRREDRAWQDRQHGSDYFSDDGPSSISRSPDLHSPHSSLGANNYSLYGQNSPKESQKRLSSYPSVTRRSSERTRDKRAWRLIEERHQQLSQDLEIRQQEAETQNAKRFQAQAQQQSQTGNLKAGDIAARRHYYSGQFPSSMQVPHVTPKGLQQYPRLQKLRDQESGVDRCPICTWELEDGGCQQCGLVFDESGEISNGLQQTLVLQKLRDQESGVDRCPVCTWELEDGGCQQCGLVFDESGEISWGDSFSGFSDMDEISEQGELGEQCHPREHKRLKEAQERGELDIDATREVLRDTADHFAPDQLFPAKTELQDRQRPYPAVPQRSSPPKEGLQIQTKKRASERRPSYQIQVHPSNSASKVEKHRKPLLNFEALSHVASVHILSMSSRDGTYTISEDCTKTSTRHRLKALKGDDGCAPTKFRKHS
jgi:hypothetical protein